MTPVLARSMPVVTFDAHGTVLTAGERRWFVLRPDGRTPYLVDGVCPHRGGPLHLGTIVPGAGGAVECPWHGRCSGVRKLRRGALPLVVRAGGTATAVLPAGTERAAVLRRTVLAVADPSPADPAGGPLGKDTRPWATTS